MRPDWSTAPDWANYWVMDEDGVCYWFEKLPVAATCSWQPEPKSRVWYASTYENNWRDSLQQRPS